ncbi:MAG: hypothetical protein KIT87_15365 [Anaerolineae bacterium]|nr:hypothetical protein [Anaerolineae bacterium]
MKVVVATRSLEVFEALHRMGMNGANSQSALFTGQVYDSLKGANLVVVDFEDLVPHPYSTDMLRGLLTESNVLYVNSADFLTRPQHWMDEARRAGGLATDLPKKRVIAFVSYSGGVGKTTLAIDTALYFARRTKLPVLLTEFVYGESAIAPLTNPDAPHLFDLVTQVDVQPAKWNGITLAPMDYENVRDLSASLLTRWLKEQMDHHVLTVIDGHWPHALLGTAGSLRDEVDDWFILAAPRPDAVENGLKLRDELGERKARLVLNLKGGTLDSLTLNGIKRDLDLPNIKQADRFEGKLGRAILAQTYGRETWRKYERTSLVDRIGAAFRGDRNHR